MPEFRHPREMEVAEGGPGWRVTRVADGRCVHGLGMALRRWRLEPGRRTPERPAAPARRGPGERFLYVVAGEGAVTVGDQRMELGPEDVVWLEPQDAFDLEAGGRGLEVLEASSE
jgi:quercetin dioxygenase-like cupin family protein